MSIAILCVHDNQALGSRKGRDSQHDPNLLLSQSLPPNCSTVFNYDVFSATPRPVILLLRTLNAVLESLMRLLGVCKLASEETYSVPTREGHQAAP